LVEKYIIRPRHIGTCRAGSDSLLQPTNQLINAHQMCL
jgi:hypothetical protein